MPLLGGCRVHLLGGLLPLHHHEEEESSPNELRLVHLPDRSTAWPAQVMLQFHSLVPFMILLHSYGYSHLSIPLIDRVEHQCCALSGHRCCTNDVTQCCAPCPVHPAQCPPLAPGHGSLVLTRLNERGSMFPALPRQPMRVRQHGIQIAEHKTDGSD